VFLSAWRLSSANACVPKISGWQHRHEFLTTVSRQQVPGATNTSGHRLHIQAKAIIAS